MKLIQYCWDFQWQFQEIVEVSVFTADLALMAESVGKKSAASFTVFYNACSN